jgi:hypothetical protein
VSAHEGAPILPEFPWEQFGVPVSFVGEDGAVLMLGWHEPRKAVAVILRHARRDCGLDAEDVFGNYADTLEDVAKNLTRTHALFTDDRDHGWYCRTGKDAATPYALPVTVWQP